MFQAELSTKKVTQGALFTDPRAGVKKFGDIRREYTGKLNISADTLEVHERNYRGRRSGNVRGAPGRHRGPDGSRG